MLGFPKPFVVICWISNGKFVQAINLITKIKLRSFILFIVNIIFIKKIKKIKFNKIYIIFTINNMKLLSFIFVISNGIFTTKKVFSIGGGGLGLGGVTEIYCSGPMDVLINIDKDSKPSLKYKFKNFYKKNLYCKLKDKRWDLIYLYC